MTTLHELKNLTPKLRKKCALLYSFPPGRRTLFCALMASAFVFAFVNASALTYYSRASGNWNQKSTWSTIGNGSAVNYGTYPAKDDFVYIKSGHTITITEDAACIELCVGDGTSGILQFGDRANYTLTVYGSLKIYPHAIFQYASKAGRQHVLVINGDFDNNGDVKFFLDKDDYVSIIFRSDRSSYVFGKGTWSGLANIVIDKNNRTDEVYIYSKGFGNALTAGLNPPVIFIKGTFRYNIPDHLSNLIDPGSYTDPQFTISPDMIIQVEQGTVDLATYPGMKATAYCRLQGELLVHGGKVTISKGAKGDEKTGLFYSGISPAPRLEIKGGNVDCYGAFTALVPGRDNIDFTMTRGTFTANMGTLATKLEPFRITGNEGSSVNFSGGVIIVQNKSSYGNNAAKSDFDLGGPKVGKYDVSGTATVQFGNALTPSGQTMRFTAYDEFVYPHVVVSCREEGKRITVRPYNPSNFTLLSLTINEKSTFDMRDVATSKDDHVLTLCSEIKSFAFVNNGTFQCRYSTVKLTGGSVQTIGGITSRFCNLDFENESALSNDVVVTGILYVNATVNLNSKNLILGVSENTPGTLLYKSGRIHGGIFKSWAGVEYSDYMPNQKD